MGTGEKPGEEVNRWAMTQDRGHSGGVAGSARNREGRGCHRPGSLTRNGIEWGEGLKGYKDKRLENLPTMA